MSDFKKTLGNDEIKLTFIRKVLNKLLFKFKLSRFVTIKRNGYMIRMFPSSMSYMRYLKGKSYRNDEEDFFQDYLKKGDIVLDIGSNIGLLTLKSSSLVGDEGHVYSFEANPKIANFQRSNIKLNKFENITLTNSAIGNKTGTVRFIDSLEDDTMNKVDFSDSALEVKIDKIDNIISNCTINLLKVDVEGFELFVLEGAKKVLTSTECIFFEVCNQNFEKFGYTSVDLFNLLNSYNFDIFRIEDKILQRVATNYDAKSCEDMVAINVNKFQDILKRFNLYNIKGEDN